MVVLAARRASQHGSLELPGSVVRAGFISHCSTRHK
jgi:hypothetical protein